MSFIKIIFLFLFSTFVLPAEAKTTIEGFETEVLTGCNKLTHALWIKRYSLVEDKVIATLEKNPQLAQAKDKELFEVVFPQDLPDSTPMKGAYVGCFEIFHDYQKAINNVQSLKALKRLESCYRDAYKKDPPKVLGKYMDCLKRIKY